MSNSANLLTVCYNENLTYQSLSSCQVSQDCQWWDRGKTTCQSSLFFGMPFPPPVENDGEVDTL